MSCSPLGSATRNVMAVTTGRASAQALHHVQPRLQPVTRRVLRCTAAQQLDGPAQPQRDAVARTVAARASTANVVEVEAPPVVLEQPSPQPQAFDWFQQWYPVAFVKDLDKAQLHRFTLLRMPLVIWWDATVSAWRAFKDECPHRLVPLSEGRINQQGELECGYHGWSFSGNGSCTRIPQGGNAASPRACATSFYCEERQGLLFVYAEAIKPDTPMPNPSLIPIVPELEDPSWASQDTWRDLPYDFSVLLENVLDSSHVPFTHHKSMSNRNVINNYNIQLQEPVGEAGFFGVWASGPRGGSLGPQSTEFRPPMYMKHKLQGKTIESLVIVYAVPMGPGKCRLINRNCFKGSFRQGVGSLIGKVLRLMPGWFAHVGSHVLLEDDQIFLHHGESEVASRKARGQKMGQAYYTPSQADTYVLALHRWLDKWGGGGPFGHINEAYLAALGPRLTREQLLDRWSQHTETCAQCQKGLSQVKAAQRVAEGVQGVLQAAALLCAATAAVASTLAPAGQGAAAALASEAQPGLASVLLVALQAVVGGSLGVEDLVMRGALFGAAALATAVLGTKLEEVRQSFYTGVYPPPRNLAKD